MLRYGEKDLGILMVFEAMKMENHPLKKKVYMKKRRGPTAEPGSPVH